MGTLSIVRNVFMFFIMLGIFVLLASGCMTYDTGECASFANDLERLFN